MFKPRYFQSDAVELAVRELHRTDRASVVMCCGAGKTYTGALIAQALNANVRVVLAPTIMLASQIASEYRALFKDPVFEFHSQANLVEELSVMLSERKATFVTTYNSAPVLLACLDQLDADVDLLIYDEVHRTAGKFSTLFNQTLTGYPGVKKRLGMTATPRHAAYDESDDEVEFFSMDNEELYGKIVYSYQIRQAISDGVISDYKLLVACVTDGEVRDYLHGKTVSDSDHKTYALAMTLKRAMEQYGLKKIITYHATIDEAEKAQRIFKEIIDVPVTHVSSEQGPYTRNANFRIYSESDSCIITNARCLNEGMNVPDTDAVMFCSAKTSATDIIQCAGRALRRHPGKDMGYIILPILSGENALETSDFAPIMRVLNSLSENDELLHQAIRLSKPTGNHQSNSLLPAFFRFTDDSTFNVQVLAEKIYLRIYERFNRSFFDYVEQLREYVQEHGHARVKTVSILGNWVRRIRAMYREKRLAKEKVDILKSIGFVWNTRDELFWSQFNELEAWLKEGNSVEEASTGPFSGFLKVRRAAWRKGTLPDDQAKALESAGVYLDVKEHVFNRNLELLKNVLNEHKQVPRGSPVTDWVKYLRKKYNENSLSSDDIRKIEATGLKLNLADEYHEIFLEKLDLLARVYYDNEPLTPVLNSFRGAIRKQYKKGTLKDIRLNNILELQEKHGIDILGSR